MHQAKVEFDELVARARREPEAFAQASLEGPGNDGRTAFLRALRYLLSHWPRV